MNAFIPTLVVGVILATTTLGVAQDNKDAKAAKRSAAIEQRVNRLAQQLELKEEQKTKIKALFEEQEKKAMALREDTSSSPQERREKARAIREEHDKKLKGILTPDQFAKLEKQREADREKFKSRGERKGEKKNQ